MKESLQLNPELATSHSQLARHLELRLRLELEHAYAGARRGPGLWGASGYWKKAAS